MTLQDIDTGRTYTLPELWKEWKQFRSEEPWNHADTFRTELYEILMATINGRNDCQVDGLTTRELCNYILSIRSRIRRGVC